METLPVTSLDMILSNKRIRMRWSDRCTGWSAPLLFANTENRFTRAEDQIEVYHVVLFGVVFYVLTLFHRFQVK